MDRKLLCIAIIFLIVFGVILNIIGQAFAYEKLYPNPKTKAKETLAMQKAALWCTNLSYLMAGTALLCILCCLCCRDVEFGKGKDEY